MLSLLFAILFMALFVYVTTGMPHLNNLYNWLISKTKYKQYQFVYISSERVGGNIVERAWFKTDEEALSYRIQLNKQHYRNFEIVSIVRPYYKVIQSPYHKV